MTSTMNKNFSTTGAIDACAVRYPTLSGISVPANVDPDVADTGVVIPLRLTTYSGLTTKAQTQSIDMMPIINPNDGGFAIGGKTIGYGPMELAKIQIEGYMDTPCTPTTVDGELLNIPTPTFSGMSVTYADLITAYMEGRANIASTDIGAGVTLESMWTRVNPSWFRDPFGRVYNTPKVVSFTGSYVEQVPGRTTFTMVMQVQPYDT